MRDIRRMLAAAVTVVAAAATGASQTPPGAGSLPPPDTCGRLVDEIIVHCSATPEGRDVTAADIRVWHLHRGFADIGYHYVVRLSGLIETGRPLHIGGAHCLGHNPNSVGVCYIGGCDASMHPADTRTPAQRQALDWLLRWLRGYFPRAAIHGHRDFAAKACPSFDATDEYQNLD